jgi:hypothetical protein
MYKVSVVPGMDRDIILVAEQTSEAMKFSDKVVLRFGQYSKTMEVNRDCTIDPNTIVIPKSLSEWISIPDLPYEVRVSENALSLGPVIGFMNNKIFYENPDLISSRFANYNRILGLIFIFGKEQVDTNRRLILGKYFNPKTESFDEGILPYPTVIYLRTNPGPDLHRHFTKYLGAKCIYNYPFLSNKWVFWRLISINPELRSYLPETKKYTTVEDALEMLEKYGAVYLKPFNLSRGRGILSLRKRKGEYLLRDSEGNCWIVNNNRALSGVLREKLRRKYLIQQEIPFQYTGRKVDFRIYLQKDKFMHWQCLWAETRLAEVGSIITNVRNRFEVMPAIKGLRLIFQLDNHQAKAKIAEIASVCVKILELLEGNGHSLGDVAFDFILDESLQLWLLEVQPSYFSDVFTREYLTPIIHPNSFDYAKALAGFNGSFC